MENNEILERLLQDDKQAQTTVKDDTTAKKSQEVQISKIRIVSAKYKVYIVVLAILVCFLVLIYIPKENTKLESNNSAFDQVNSKLTSLKRDITAAEDDMRYLCNKEDWIVNNEEKLKNCLNNDDGCSNLPKSWIEWTGDDVHYNFSNPISLSYLQTNSLYNEKMPVDEKRVLKNLNEYLIKQDILWTDKKRVWEILKINIWDPESIAGTNEHFFSVPVDVEIEFDTVWDLTWFLYNVEKKMVDNGEDRLLYKIQSVSYDIVTNDEPQITDISMIAYYYYDKDINDQAACGNGSGDNRVNNNRDDDTSDSVWFFQKILNSFRK